MHSQRQCNSSTFKVIVVICAGCFMVDHVWHDDREWVHLPEPGQGAIRLGDRLVMTERLSMN